MKCFAVLIFAAALAFGATGCKSTDPATGTRVYDPIKTAQVKDALRPVITDPLSRVLRNSPEHAVVIGNYYRGVGGVFCAMQATKQFDPQFLINAVNSIAVPQLDPTVVTIKNALIALYSIFYRARHTAELPEDQFLFHLSELFCSSVNQALIDAGQPGIPSPPQ
jgi:hypothetical protein